MGEKRPLPDPLMMSRPDGCTRCGYSLAGLAAPCLCPECGLEIVSEYLVLAGVHRAASGHMPLARRAVWIAVCVLFAMVYFMWGYLLFRAPWLLLGIAGVLAGCIIWLLATSQRERSAYERFIITSGGIARAPFKIKEGETNIDTLFVDWRGANTFQIKRVSVYWKRLVVGTLTHAGTIEKPVFDAGFRCPDEMTAVVHSAIERAMRSRGVGPGGAEQNALS